MSFSSIGTRLLRTGILARRPLGLVARRAGPEFKFDYLENGGKYNNPIPADQDLDPDWVFPDQDDYFINGPLSPQKWLGFLGVIAIGSYAVFQFLMLIAPENPAAPKNFEGNLWEEYGGDPAKAPSTPAEIRKWKLSQGGRDKFKEEDLMTD